MSSNSSPIPSSDRPKVGSHDATASLLGYVHQARWGLLELLLNRVTNPDRKLALEMHDDIAWDIDGVAVDLKQLKLHAKEVRALGNASVDLWRTIGVWLDCGQPKDAYGPTLTLITNSVATDGSVAALLRADSTSRDPTRALAILEEVAEQTGNAATKAVRKAFMKLAPSERATFVDRMYVADGSPDMAGVDDEVAHHLQPGAPIEHFDTYLDQVWGWWNRTAIGILKKERDTISVAEMLTALERIRDQFTSENLPPLVDDDEINEEMRAQHDNSTFVRQLRWVGMDAQPRQLQKAIDDYQRAFLQETRWMDRHLVDHDELERFTHRLVDEWEREFDFMCGELSEEATEDEKRSAGRLLLRTLSNSPLRIRVNFQESFHSRGRRHALADETSIGWHPEFSAHVDALLLGDDASASA